MSRRDIAASSIGGLAILGIIALPIDGLLDVVKACSVSSNLDLIFRLNESTALNLQMNAQDDGELSCIVTALVALDGKTDSAVAVLHELQVVACVNPLIRLCYSLNLTIVIVLQFNPVELRRSTCCRTAPRRRRIHNGLAFREPVRVSLYFVYSTETSS